MAIRNVRNWWFKARVDGRMNTMESGPKAKDGCFDLEVLQRSEGLSRLALKIHTQVDHLPDGINLTLVITDGDGKAVHAIRTRR